jgi:hypothetical protein
MVVTMKMFALSQKDISAAINAIRRYEEKHLQRCQVVLNRTNFVNVCLKYLFKVSQVNGNKS